MGIAVSDGARPAVCRQDVDLTLHAMAMNSERNTSKPPVSRNVQWSIRLRTDVVEVLRSESSSSAPRANATKASDTIKTVAVILIFTAPTLIFINTVFLIPIRPPVNAREKTWPGSARPDLDGARSG
jgi:hypothetical protein